MMNSEGTSTIFKKGIAALSKEAKEAAYFPSGHPEGFLCAFSNIYSAIFKAIRLTGSTKINQLPLSKVIGQYDFPGIEDGIMGISFVEAILKSNRSEEKWTIVSP